MASPLRNSEVQTACLRWAVDVASWEPSAAEFEELLRSLLPQAEQQAVLAFRQEADRKRALVSRLLQWACVSRVCRVAWADVAISRTKGRKPFATNPKPPHSPNFNFNVSHEGDFVALASEPVCICGLDVAAPQQLRPRGQAGGPLWDALAPLQGSFAPEEWALVEAARGDEPRMEACFQRLWGLKEAFIKARGDGLGFDPLSRARFSFEGGAAGALEAGTATVHVDGAPQPRWRFCLQRLPRGHWAAVARGPPEAIVDAHGVFTASLQQQSIPDDQMRAHLGAQDPPFQMLRVQDLLPPGAPF